MVNSMTGFASLTGHTNDFSWALEIKSVNARGLDVRVRASDGGGDTEQFLKSEISKSIQRGTVNVFFKTEASEDVKLPVLNVEILPSIFDSIAKIESSAAQSNVQLSQTSAADVMKVSGVYVVDQNVDRTADVLNELKENLPNAIQAFAQARADEGHALQNMLNGQLEQVSNLIQQAHAIVMDRKDVVAAKLKQDLQNLLISEAVDENRLEQELAILAVKSDITEEIDRLLAHVASAKEMLASEGAVGRKLDFLMQEFNREANTLCSKSGSKELTRIGLELKTVIDQMREQVQNVE